MKKILLFYFCLITAVRLQAQNLVPNPGFEIHTGCSDPNYYIENSPPWNGFETPDYFNSCVNTSFFFNTDVPINYFGSQIPIMGNAYVGLVSYFANDAREYIYAKFASALTTSELYCISFNVSLADSSKYAVKTIGAYLSNDTVLAPYMSTSTPPYHTFNYYTPQIESNYFISDTTNWTSVNGLYTAQGSEQFITIGNFRDNANTDTLRVRNSTTYPYSYYYVDDISVEQVIPAHAGNDTSFYLNDSIQLGNNTTENATYSWSPSTGLSDVYAANPKASPGMNISYIVTKTQCSVVTKDTVTLTYLGIGINEKDLSKRIKLYPNPNNGEMTLECNLQDRENGSLVIYSLTGKIIKLVQLSSGTKSLRINVQELQAGLYLYEVRINGKESKKNKLTIIK